MKKDFRNLVDQVVKGWQQNKNKLLEKQGLGGLSSREYGDKAEDYVVKKVKQLKPDYKPVKSNNSESPADIFAVTYRNWFWHIMLIQVKSSKEEENIEQLDSDQEKVFNELAKYLKKEIKESLVSGKNFERQKNPSK